MIVRIYWPNCSLAEGESADCLWVECTQSEAALHVYPLLAQELIDISVKYSDTKFRLPGEEEAATFCFLISPDLSKILPHPPYFPYSGLWNAYNPFRELKSMVVVEKLSDLKYFSPELRTITIP